MNPCPSNGHLLSCPCFLESRLAHYRINSASPAFFSFYYVLLIFSSGYLAWFCVFSVLKSGKKLKIFVQRSSAGAALEIHPVLSAMSQG